MGREIITRRRFLKLAGGAVLALASGCAFSTQKMTAPLKENIGQPLKKAAKTLTGDASLDARFLRQLVTADCRTSRRIMWQSEEEQAKAQIVWREKGQSELHRVPAEQEGFADDGQRMYIHQGLLEGLKPGAEYEYCISCGEEGTPWQSLRTDKGAGFQMLIFTDSQSNDYTDWKNIVQAAAKRHPEAQLFTTLGDLVDNGEDHYQWEQWFEGLAGVQERLPFAPVMGNHETYDQKWQVRLPLAYLAHFLPPDNGSRDFSRYYYSFDYGDVHFIVLNTQWQEIDDFQQGLLEEQKEWLRKDARASKKKWRVVMMHRDVLRYGIHNRPQRVPGIEFVGKELMPLFDELHIDAVLTGHLHTYRNRGHIRNFVRDEKGPLYLLNGLSGNVRYPGLWIDHELDKKIAPQPETDNYLTLDAARDALTFRCYLPDGKLIDEVTLRKS